ncbi:MAG: recombinase family protein [Clostridia bacterium]
MSKKIGYIRISSSSQSLDRQIDEMLNLGIEKENIYEDVISGAIKGEDRIGYNYMKRGLRKGDVLYISSIDRLGRDYDNIISEWKDITINKKADIKVLDMPLLDTTKNKDLLGNLITDLVVQLLGYVAQTEREKIKARQKAGIESARARGKRLGRPEVYIPSNFIEEVEKWRRGEQTAVATFTKLNMPKTTFYREVKKRGL